MIKLRNIFNIKQHKFTQPKQLSQGTLQKYKTINLKMNKFIESRPNHDKNDDITIFYRIASGKDELMMHKNLVANFGEKTNIQIDPNSGEFLSIKQPPYKKWIRQDLDKKIAKFFDKIIENFNSEKIEKSSVFISQSRSNFLSSLLDASEATKKKLLV